MKVLYLTQAANEEDISTVTDSLPEGTELTLLTGSNVSIKNGKVVKVTPHDSRSLMSRLKCWMAYKRDVLRWAKHAEEQFDVIYANSNPPINSFVGLKMKKRFYAPFIYMNWDLYPQIIEESYNNVLIRCACKIWHWSNNRNYKRIDQILTIGPIMAESINKPLKEKIDIHIVPMWSDVDQLVPLDKAENIFIKQNSLDNQFVVLYSGKLGYGHNITPILDAAELLKDNAQICFVFIGKGPKCEEVQERINAGATNVRMFPYQPEGILKYSISCGDIGIVSQEEKLAHLFLPSKTYSMLSCGMPVIGLCSEHDDLKRLLDDNEVGISISNATAQKVADSILALYKDPEIRQGMSIKARQLMIDKYSREAILKRYVEEFEMVINRRT